jgi:hypothetical protein
MGPILQPLTHAFNAVLTIRDSDACLPTLRTRPCGSIRYTVPVNSWLTAWRNPINSPIPERMFKSSSLASLHVRQGLKWAMSCRVKEAVLAKQGSANKLAKATIHNSWLIPRSRLLNINVMVAHNPGI